METPYIILAFNVVLSVAAFFGGMVIRDLSTAVKELREADERLVERMGQYAKMDDLREFRAEQRDSMTRLFDKLDQMTASMTDRMDKTSSSMTSKVDQVHAKIDKIQTELHKKVGRDELVPVR